MYNLEVSQIYQIFGAIFISGIILHIHFRLFIIGSKGVNVKRIYSFNMSEIIIFSI
jgi:hypothetical protein